MENFDRHTCQPRRAASAAMEAEVAQLRDRNEALNATVTQLKAELEASQATTASLRATLADVQDELTALRSDQRLSLPILFTGSYHYNRHSVVQLTQLVARYLEGVPYHIDSNRIFNCVKGIYDDCARNWNDNPDHLRMDTIMLLSVCWASCWFTDNQRNHIYTWRHDLGLY